jgi:hypothetical protein
MTPAEHYREAEELVARAGECAVASITRSITAMAQVHATLATCYQLEDEQDAVALDCGLGPSMVTAETTGDRL